jgi:hypothetical protein
MTHRTGVLAAVLLCLALAGCGDSTPDVTPSSGSSTTAMAAPTPVSDEATIRQLCNTIVGLADEDEFDPNANLAAGRIAEQITDPKFSLGGRALMKAAAAASVAPGADTNIDIAQAQLDILNACGDRFGDGPW